MAHHYRDLHTFRQSENSITQKYDRDRVGTSIHVQMVVCIVADVVNEQYYYQLVTSINPNAVHPSIGTKHYYSRFVTVRSCKLYAQIGCAIGNRPMHDFLD